MRVPDDDTRRVYVKTNPLTGEIGLYDLTRAESYRQDVEWFGEIEAQAALRAGLGDLPMAEWAARLDACPVCECAITDLAAHIDGCPYRRFVITTRPKRGRRGRAGH